MAITPVIMSGGAGSRLWPLSNEERPKQFLPLIGPQTMLEETIHRLKAELFEPKTVILAGTPQVDILRKQMSKDDHVIIGEPCRRNTAAAAVAAALYVQQNSPEDDLLLLAPADHVITFPGAFHKAVEKATDSARNGYIVTFGIYPESPETGYGYIKRSESISEGVFKVEDFKEKPDEKTAREYCDSGEFDWNSGIFLFSAEKFLQEMARFEPKILEAVTEAYDKAVRAGNLIALNEEAFENAPSNSIDYAVMERTDKAAVVPCNIGWSDLGSYRSLFDVRQKHEVSCHPENTQLLDSKDCLVMSDGPQVNIVGLENVGVIVEGDRVLVLNLDDSQKVKDIAEFHKKNPD
tara:strand:+ start:648 stop:1697 length:1050 start_codon:yes stop_codon:yes gene_type:complete